MFDLIGRYGTAKVYADIVAEDTISQIMSVLNTPLASNSKIRIMADCHSGAGCVVGTTMQVVDKICPNLVGVDIGCGMLVVNLGKIDVTNEFLAKLDVICHRVVPSGFAIHNNIPLDLWKMSYGKKYGFKNFIEAFFEEFRCLDKLDSLPRLEKSLGSLGGGNHFIELDKSDDGTVYLVIHSGSRNLGKQICDYYQKLAISKMNGDEASEGFIPKQLSYLVNHDLDDYLHDLGVCQGWASWNRKMIATLILKNLYDVDGDLEWNDSEVSSKGINFSYFETIHNYIDLDNMILRKGAVSAQKDEILLIPINMRDGSLICRGLGNDDFNFSAPHGAGRLMSRSKAKETISLDEFKVSMKEVYSTTVDSSTLDESPFAYKPIESILGNIKETVDVLEIVKPIYNFKASGPEIKANSKEDI